MSKRMGECSSIQSKTPPEGGAQAPMASHSSPEMDAVVFPQTTQNLGEQLTLLDAFSPCSSSLLQQRVLLENCTLQKQWVLQFPSTCQNSI